MRTLTVAVALLALIAVPAYAQMGGKRPHGDDKKAEQKKPQIDEKAYKAALDTGTKREVRSVGHRAACGACQEK